MDVFLNFSLLFISKNYYYGNRYGYFKGNELFSNAKNR